MEENCPKDTKWKNLSPANRAVVLANIGRPSFAVPAPTASVNIKDILKGAFKDALKDVFPSEPQTTTPEVPDESKGKWVTLSEAAIIRGVTKATLEKYRAGGTTAANGLSGKDRYGFFWKREAITGKNAATTYFIPDGD